MKHINKIAYLLLPIFFLVSACQDFETDLEVVNRENPNDEILASDPVALESTAGNILQSWYRTVHSTNGPAAALATMADVSTASWGNFGMRDLSSEPRTSFNNSTGYSNDVTDTYFNSLYSLLTDSNTIVGAVEAGTEFSNPKMVEMMGKLGQALSIGHLALVFDRVWIYDANGPVGENETGETDYVNAMEYALQKLDEAIAIADANTFTLPEAWLPGVNATSERMSEIMNSMGARMLVGNLRNSAQKSTLDWNRVYEYADNGITTDFDILMDDINWYALVPQTYLVYPGWGRVDMRVINMMDPNTPAYWTDDINTLPESTSADARLATDYEYLASNNFSPDRGKYHFSTYRYARLNEYITEWTVPVTEISKSESDLYKAEALLHINGGDAAAAAAIVNAGTRTTRGELPPVSANADEVYDAIHYERMVEFAYTGMGISFFEMRKEDLLQKGTLLHFPVPGKALDAIPEPYYTYGGTSGVAGEDYSNGGWR
ncbi:MULTISPECIES: RagB/SusD family nutrient uptake outer membrane protein [Arenibacter]|uniref:RagB/SusD family nutrient uptake outer membrane protein n=1 Tax=Arenibacter TaxID=178469 RepID=UPI000A3CFD10|nr:MULTISPECIES: RagB/SusD family nutrient uptake outer membrane protein [Arenibacter]